MKIATKLTDIRIIIHDIRKKKKKDTSAIKKCRSTHTQTYINIYS